MSAAPEFQSLGIGNHRLRCPHCGRSDRDRTMGVTVEHDRVVWHCHRCAQAGAQREQRTYMRPGAVRPQTTTPKQHITLASPWRDAWQRCTPIQGIAAKYLSARKCAQPPADGDLRYTEAPRHPSGYVGPALVALVTDAITREPMTLHRTWIKADGTKADVDPPRLLLGKHRKAGGVVRLWPNDAVTTGLAIAEGIETALAVATAYRPVWSCIDASNLAAFPVLDGIESLLIVADGDDVGIRAANACAERWARAGREVRLAVPPRGMDAADLARSAA